MTYECNNVSQCHELRIICDGDSCLRVVCTHCWHQYCIRKDPYKGVPENRQYSRVFKREILQGNDNLLYKYFPQFMNT